jgi:hypothetical protein
LDEVRRHPRRRLLGRLAADVIDGAHALGELDLGRGLRSRALPPPVRQAVRVLTAGKVLALRIDEEAVLDRIETVFRARGWRAARSPSSSTSAAAASG